MDHEKTGDYGRSFSDYQTTMDENPEMENPLKLHALLSTPAAVLGTSNYRAGVECSKNICAWWDADKGRCAVLSLARNK